MALTLVNAGSGTALEASAFTLDRYRDVVVVVGAHPWAGTSIVALAIADAVADLGAAKVRLVDTSSPVHSGLVGVTDRELGVFERDWRAGQRGHVTVERPAVLGSDRLDVSAFRVTPGVPTVVDAAQSLARATWLGHLTRRARVVVVARATVPGLRQAELLLAEIVGEPLLVAVGVRRLHRGVVPPGSRRVAAAYDAGRLVCVPHDRRLAVFGADESPLPRSVLRAGGEIARLLWPKDAEEDR